MRMKNYRLTDFNTERWKGINIESVQSQIEVLNEKAEKDLLIGEFRSPDIEPITFEKVSHLIKNLTFVDGEVYGDVKFLETESGKKAEAVINLDPKFAIRAMGDCNNGEIFIHSIITWDVPFFEIYK